MSTVIVYRNLLLPISETFIKTQMEAYQRWKGVLVGARLCHQLALDALTVRVLEPDNSSVMTRAVRKVRRLTGGVPGLELLAREKPDLIHAHFGTDALAVAPMARALRVPLIVTLHGFDINVSPDWWHSGKGGWSMRGYPEKLKNIAVRDDVSFVAVSNSIKRRAMAYGIPERKINVRYIGVDILKFRPGPISVAHRSRRILFVGRLVEKKGCEILLRAMQLVIQQINDAELVIVGDGPLRQSLEDLDRSLGTHAQFKGSRTSPEVGVELDLARIVCIPSITADNGDAEGLPIVMLEAQAKGVPVVSSAAGGDEGLVDGESGALFTESDVTFLSRTLCAILCDDLLATRMSLAGPKFIARRFDIRTCTRDLESLYDQVVS